MRKIKLSKLESLYYLTADFNHTQDKLRELRAEAESPKVAKYTDMPKAKSVNDVLASDTVRRLELERQLEAIVERLWEEKHSIEIWIETVPETYRERLLFKMRHVELMSFPEMADVFGDGHMEDTVKKQYYSARNKYCIVDVKKNKKVSRFSR